MLTVVDQESEQTNAAQVGIGALGPMNVDNQGRNGTMTLQVQVWRVRKQQMPEESYVLHSEVSIPSNLCCNTSRTSENGITRIKCTLPKKVDIKRGDILGIILQSNGTKSEINLCFKRLPPPSPNSTRGRFCAYTFNSSELNTTLTLPDSQCMGPHNLLQPQISMVRVDGEDRFMSCTSDEDPTSTSGKPYLCI